MFFCFSSEFQAVNCMTTGLQRLLVLAASKETYSQRRRLPMETFRVFVEAEAVQEPRPAQGATWIQRCKRGDLEKRPVTNSFVQTGSLPKNL